MKAVLVLLVITIVAAYAVDVDLNFIKSALAFKNHVMKRGAEVSITKRKMLGVNWSASSGGKCSPLGAKCYMLQSCCDKKKNRCSSFLGGKCIKRSSQRRTMFRF